MKELLCPCGCARQSILDCPCGTAAELRGKIMAMMAGADLSSEAGRDRRVRRGARDVQDRLRASRCCRRHEQRAVALPVLAAIGGLGLLLVVGRRFVTRGAIAVAAAPKLEGEDETLRRQARRRARGHGLAIDVRILRLSARLAEGAVDGIAAPDDRDARR